MSWTSLFWLIFCGVALMFLTRWINRHIQGIGILLTRSGETALIVYFALIFPGILLHEVSHWATAKILGVPTGRFHFGIRRQRNGSVQLGAVEVALVDPIRNALIGLAPLLVGSVAILLIGRYVLRIPLLLSPFSWETLQHMLSQTVRAPDFGIWSYLLLTITNTMFPSPADRHAWGTTALLLLPVVALFYFVGWISPLTQSLAPWISAVLVHLGYAFTVALTFDLILALVLLVLEQTLCWILGRRLEYR